MALLPHIPTRAVRLAARTTTGLDCGGQQLLGSAARHAAFGLMTLSHMEEEWIIISLSLVCDPSKLGIQPAAREPHVAFSSALAHFCNAVSFCMMKNTYVISENGLCYSAGTWHYS